MDKIKYYSYYSNIVYVARNGSESSTVVLATNKKEAQKLIKIFPDLTIGERIKGSVHLYEPEKMQEQIELLKQCLKDKKIYFRKES